MVQKIRIKQTGATFFDTIDAVNDVFKSMIDEKLLAPIVAKGGSVSATAKTKKRLQLLKEFARCSLQFPPKHHLVGYRCCHCGAQKWSQAGMRKHCQDYCLTSDGQKWSQYSVSGL